MDTLKMNRTKYKELWLQVYRGEIHSVKDVGLEELMKFINTYPRELVYDIYVPTGEEIWNDYSISPTQPGSIVASWSRHTQRGRVLLNHEQILERAKLKE